MVCASDDNQVQCVAYSCKQLGLYGKIYIPTKNK